MKEIVTLMHEVIEPGAHEHIFIAFCNFIVGKDISLQRKRVMTKKMITVVITMTTEISPNITVVVMKTAMNPMILLMMRRTGKL